MSILPVCLFPADASAWRATGHMVVAQIALDQLDDKTRREVERLDAVLAGFEPRFDHPVPAATWPDALRHRGLEALDGWHFINLPDNAGGLTDVAPAHQENVVWAIRQAVATLRHPAAGDLAKALMLRYLLHLVGDIHQPLHCVARFTPQHPTGDRGGNDFLLAGPAENLHTFWDETAGLFPAVEPAVWRETIPGFARRVEAAVPKTELPDVAERDPQVWARESFELARAVAYAGVEEGGVPTPVYAERARAVIEKRLALAGYRLGALLDEIFGGV